MFIDDSYCVRLLKVCVSDFGIPKKHGLRALPTAHYPDKTSGVTLKTYRLAEFIPFTRSGIRFSYDALNRLNQICEHRPVHLIYGARNDIL